MAPDTIRTTTQDALFSGQLVLRQDKGGHRAGTDAVLLAAATPPGARRIADLGAATGVVGLRAAQMTPHAMVTLIENAPEALALACENIALNALEARVTAREGDVLALGRDASLREAFDLVLTNPPFFEAGAVRASPDGARAGAHVMEAPLDDWIKAGVSVLAPKGGMVMIHRADALEALLAGFSRRLGNLRIRFIHPRAGEAAHRLVIAGTKGSRAPISVLPPLVLHDATGAFTDEADRLHRGEGRLVMA